MNFSIQQARVLMAIFVVVCLLQACQNTPSRVSTDSPTPSADANQKLALSALQKLVERELGLPVSLKMAQFNEQENHAFVMASMQQPDGSPMDYSKSQLEIPLDAFSDDVYGLLKIENGTWKVLAIAVGPTDVPYLCWWKDYNAPKSVFPEGAAAEDCTLEAPFIYVDNSGRIYVNASIGLNLEEMSEAIIEALNRMETLPTVIEPHFGEEVLMGTRQEVNTRIKEALETVKKSKQQQKK